MEVHSFIVVALNFTDLNEKQYWSWKPQALVGVPQIHPRCDEFSKTLQHLTAFKFCKAPFGPNEALMTTFKTKLGKVLEFPIPGLYGAFELEGSNTLRDQVKSFATDYLSLMQSDKFHSVYLCCLKYAGLEKVCTPLSAEEKTKQFKEDIAEAKIVMHCMESLDAVFMDDEIAKILYEVVRDMVALDPEAKFPSKWSHGAKTIAYKHGFLPPTFPEIFEYENEDEQEQSYSLTLIN